ncbi:Fatty acid desaturase [Geodermatophilus amargosae]|uniref:Fatty acid desaturase n=1 Tax=Geodermatophilus amargosae TaxID=1296565 RepID=A0A1I7CKK3_9ACTN|nr:acyl-CoA desaturase [Geodermatophilus amargosae]SFT99914.1 Fatty acid desaturase [Geodermatophilus amargosae]
MTSTSIDPSLPAAGREAVRRPRTARQTTTYSELSRRVQDAGLLRRRYAWYWTQMLLMTGAFAGVWVAFGLLGDSWLQLLVAAALAVVMAQFGFLGHDAAHRQVFASARWNDWAARIMAGAFAGLSAGWWGHKHNRHHSAPNQEGRDPDIAPGVVAFTPAVAQARTGFGAWFAARQGWAFFPLLLLEGLSLHVASLQVLAARRDLKFRRVELVLVVGRLAGYVAVLLLVLPPGKAAAFLAVQLGLFGVLLGGSFAPNHKGMPIVPEGARVDFLRRQVLVSRNIDGGPLTDLAMGGLNYQIEHHLFPSMPRPNLRRAQPIVRAFCREVGVNYTQTSLVGSYRIVVRYLNRVGLGERDPFTCPLVQSSRN